MRIITNHIGYDSAATKTAVFEGSQDFTPSDFSIYNYKTNEVVFIGKVCEIGEVDNWQLGYYYTINFDELTEYGEYYISLSCNDKEYKSFPFKIEENLIQMRTLSSAAYYFKAQRPTGEFEAADRTLPFMGRPNSTKDVRGGWYDATGDIGVHLSHLSNSLYFNPQQAAFSAYTFFKVNDLLEDSKNPYYTYLKRRMLDEGMYGADYLMRMRGSTGSFMISKGRGEAFLPLGPLATSRFISCDFRKPFAYKTVSVKDAFKEIKDEDYEAGLRSGAGYAIATLAYAARTCFPSEFSKEEYIKAAVDAYHYLNENNEKYIMDGKWNLVDEYCCLQALIEIYKTTREYDYLRRAKDMADRIMDKYVAIDDSCGYLSVDGTNRPFFHAADAGMPIVTLMEYYNIEIDDIQKEKVLSIATKCITHEIKVTKEVNNPFGYARQLIRSGTTGTIESRFFYPHDVETAPWWQGENARLGSLSAAARAMTYYVADEKLKYELNEYADNQINWILGLNPYDSCMMEGAGRNMNAYFYEKRLDFIHCPGGIINGITGGLKDEEHGIDFIMEPNDEIKDNWRWAEQWIPHATWYMYAIALKKK